MYPLIYVCGCFERTPLQLNRNILIPKIQIVTNMLF